MAGCCICFEHEEVFLISERVLVKLRLKDRSQFNPQLYSKSYQILLDWNTETGNIFE
ncbi:hypothetical protein Peur_046851 [Populus x canadensis]